MEEKSELDQKSLVPEETGEDTANAAEVVASPQTSTSSKRRLSKKKLIIATVVLLILGVTTSFFLLREDPKPAEQTPEPVNSAAPPATPVPPTPELKERSYTQVEFSDNLNGKIFSLMQGDKTVLSRNYYDWATYASDGTWLFFSSIDPETRPKEYEKPVTYALHAFNYKTLEYIDLGKLSSPDEASGIYEMHITDGHVYFTLGAYRTRGATYRCKVDAEKACGPIEKFYDLTDGVVRPRNGQFYIFAQFGDAGLSADNVYLYDPVRKTKKDIVSASSDMGVGDKVLTIDGKGKIWIAEFTGETGTQEPEPKLKRVYAVDAQKKMVASYSPNQVPLKGIDYITSQFSFSQDENKLTFVNTDENKEVVLDLLTGKFSSVRKRQNADDKKQADYLKQYREELLIPDSFTFVVKPNQNPEPDSVELPEE